MRRCQKCSLTFPDSAKICRSCGAILDDIIEEPPPHVQLSGCQREQLESLAQQVLSAPESRPADVLGEHYSWTCSQCAEEVPGSFDICWSCGTDRNGVPGPRFLDAVTESEPEPELPAGAIETVPNDQALRCNSCGSTRIVPNVQVVDQGQHSSGQLQLVVYGSPEALIFKDRRWGEITANICGECGHLELRVHNAKELYDHYIDSLDHPNE